MLEKTKFSFYDWVKVVQGELIEVFNFTKSFRWINSGSLFLMVGESITRIVE